MDALTDIATIFALQVVYVSIMTLRWIILLKGQRYLAASISVLEISIYVYALSLVITQLGNPLRVLTYAVGYAAGSLVGSWLEERLAFGYLTVQIITESPRQLPKALREAGFGVTAWKASGRDGEREVLMVVARRRWERRLYEIIDRVAPQSFVLSMEPRAFRGGFLTRRLMAAPLAAGVATAGGVQVLAQASGPLAPATVVPEAAMPDGAMPQSAPVAPEGR